MIRVVQAGPSIEFCGGTHSHSTGELGMFLMLSEFSVGSGIRRIESCVSQAAENAVAKQGDLVGDLSAALATTPDELGERIEKLQREIRDLQTCGRPNEGAARIGRRVEHIWIEPNATASARLSARSCRKRTATHCAI